MYALLPSPPATDFFRIRSDNGEVRVKDSTLLRADDGLAYRVSAAHSS